MSNDILGIWIKNLMVTYLVKQKGFYPYESMSDFEKFKEELSSKEKFDSLLADKKVSDKEYEHVLKLWNENDDRLSRVVLKIWRFFVCWCVWQI